MQPRLAWRSVSIADLDCKERRLCIGGSRPPIRSRGRFEQARGRPLASHALTEFPGVLDSGTACGVIEHTPNLLRGRYPADGCS